MNAGPNKIADSAIQEPVRDWARREHYNAVMAVVKEHCGACGRGVEYAATMVHKGPSSLN